MRRRQRAEGLHHPSVLVNGWLGALFRSPEFRKGETELLILVTPHLAKPLVPAEVVLPTDGFVEPGDFGWYFMGSMEGKDEE